MAEKSDQSKSSAGAKSKKVSKKASPKKASGTRPQKKASPKPKSQKPDSDDSQKAKSTGKDAAAEKVKKPLPSNMSKINIRALKDRILESLLLWRKLLELRVPVA